MGAIFLLLILGWSCNTTPEIPDVVTVQPNPAILKKGRVLFLDSEPYSGWIVSFYPDGQTQQRTGYLTGRKESTSTGWYRDGKLKFQRYYRQGEKEGTHLGWWPHGQKKFEYKFKDGVHQGGLKSWYENGQLYKHYHYASGYEEGSQRRWQANGKVAANYVVVDGRRFGLIGLKKCKPVQNGQNSQIN